MVFVRLNFVFDSLHKEQVDCVNTQSVQVEYFDVAQNFLILYNSLIAKM